jgi:hypothetical protein
VDYLLNKEILEKKVKSKTGPGWVVQVNPEYRELIKKFSQDGTITPVIQPFFSQYLME